MKTFLISNSNFQIKMPICMQNSSQNPPQLPLLDSNLLQGLKIKPKMKPKPTLECHAHLSEYISFKEVLECRRFKVSVYIVRMLITATFQIEPLEKKEKTTTKNSDPHLRLI